MTIAPWPKIKDPKPLRTIDGGTQLVNDLLEMNSASDLDKKYKELFKEAKAQAKLARKMYSAADKLLKNPKVSENAGFKSLIVSVRKRAYDHTMSLKKTFGKI